jgi:SAM-dependent methyltransferase
VITGALNGPAWMQDVIFDQVFPAIHRLRSWVYWTPVDVALRACALLAPTGVQRVLDVGAGVGKLCLVGAVSTSASWFGIERDAEMVRVANAAARSLGVEHRAQFSHGDVRSVDFSSYDAFYLFNPFAEVLFDDCDDALAIRDVYVAMIAYVQQQLERAAPGTRVVTYHGLGGDMPLGYELAHEEPAREDHLRLWIRTPARRHGNSTRPM